MRLILPILMAILAACIQHQPAMRLCKQPYALCTSAPCIPVPGNPSQAICTCAVKDGYSMSNTSCDRLAPSVDADGVHTIFSTFSMQQFNEGKKAMRCPDGTPWTWCLEKKCTVDPANPERAICVCDVIRSGDWVTLGGGCNPEACSNGYWSGASIPDYEAGTAFMIQKLNSQPSLAKWCPKTGQ